MEGIDPKALIADAQRFFELVRGRTSVPAASWYSAVPTLHFAVAHTGEPGGVFWGEDALPRLQFARSCSAALPPSLSERLERALAPAVALPTYAMTESFPICSNPPAHEIKLSTVGPAMGPHIKILDGHPKDAELPRLDLSRAHALSFLLCLCSSRHHL